MSTTTIMTNKTSYIFNMTTIPIAKLKIFLISYKVATSQQDPLQKIMMSSTNHR